MTGITEPNAWFRFYGPIATMTRAWRTLGERSHDPDDAGDNLHRERV